MPEYREVRINEAVRIRLTDPVGTYYVEYCTDCGVPVYNKEIHNGWHERNDEVVDWAQHISKLFTPPTPLQGKIPETWNPGDPIE